MRKIVFICLILLVGSLYSLSKEEIKCNKDYYYGEATANVYQEARDKAIKELSEKIVVNVRISTVNQAEESNLSVDEYVKSVIETYSIATFKNLQEIRTPFGSKMNVFVYIRISDVQAIFEERKQLIYDIYQESLKFEDNNNIGNALKYLYYSIILMNSLPDERLEYKDIAFHTVLPAKIREIMSNVSLVTESVREISESQKQVILAMRYKGKPIQYMRFHFWDGNNQVYVEGKDGRATLSLYGASKVLCKIEAFLDYMYYEQRREFKAVSDLWDIVKKPEFSHRIEVLFDKSDTETQEPIISYKDSDILVEDSIVLETNKLIEIIKANNVNKIKSVFPKDSFLQNQIKCLLEYNHLQIVETKSDVEITTTFDGYELRSIPIIAKYPSLNKQTTDNLVLDFDKKGKLTNIQFSVFDDMLKLATQNVKNEEELSQRKILVKFVEKYRSCFLYRDVKALETLFSDNAVIIVGRVFEPTPKLKDYKYTAYGDQPDIEYITFTKNEYLNNIRNIFNANEDIHIGYNSFKVLTKNNEPGVYAISMRQDYASSRYSDEGHLFLLIDFNDELPKIYVRSWQPGEWSDERMIEISNFKIN